MPHPIVHFEIPADDVDRLRQFYSGLFGWQTQAYPGMMEYVMVETGADFPRVNGGIMKRQSPQHKPTNYVLVESVTDYAKKAEQLGGQVIIPKTEIPDMGHFAVCLDPEGNPFGLFESNMPAA